MKKKLLVILMSAFLSHLVMAQAVDVVPYSEYDKLFPHSAERKSTKDKDSGLSEYERLEARVLKNTLENVVDTKLSNSELENLKNFANDLTKPIHKEIGLRILEGAIESGLIKELKKNKLKKVIEQLDRNELTNILHFAKTIHFIWKKDIPPQYLDGGDYRPHVDPKTTLHFAISAAIVDFLEREIARKSCQKSI